MTYIESQFLLGSSDIKHILYTSTLYGNNKLEASCVSRTFVLDYYVLCGATLFTRIINLNEYVDIL